MASAIKVTHEVEVVKRERQVQYVELRLSDEEARELRAVISDMTVSFAFTHVTAIRNALEVAGYRWEHNNPRPIGYLKAGL